MKKEVYLDNSATTRPYDEVIDYMSHINRNEYGNPSSLHKKGIEAERHVKKARELIADSLGVAAKEIYFTSGGTESNNLAIRGYLEANPRKGKHILTTAIEHPSVLEVFKYLAEKGYRPDYIGVDSNGVIDLDMLRSKITPETALISVIMVNNEVGSIQPVEKVVKIKNSINKSCVVHVDAVQAYGKIKIFPKKLGIDLLSISSHKIHGPKGTGALYVGSGVRIKPILFGGGQESLLRSGTENTAGICGFGLASEMVFKNLEENYHKVRLLKNRFLEGLKETGIACRVLSGERASPYIINVSFEGVKAEVLLHHLEERNIFVSTGSACSSRKNLHSHVLKAMGLKACDMEGAVRFSLSELNDHEDIIIALEALKDIIPRIQMKRP
ncbi:MAG: cysteine desulfurase family protein [Clostridiales bacterium]|jgi:cysteine desulfurase|nr:cysteine desulfurase [Eubacteriales bacterium]MDH7565135.1 cysteine desulfurase family protein [Clostridiales bacterium]